MKILIMKITLRAPWVHSLKEKRMIVRSLIQKLKNKFNISVAEVENQDIHSTIDIGIAGLARNSAQADSIMEHIITFVENNTDAEIVQIEKDEDILKCTLCQGQFKKSLSNIKKMISVINRSHLF